MDSLEAKKTYVAELKNIINRVQCEYDIAELAKGSDERTKELLKEKFSILGYGIFFSFEICKISIKIKFSFWEITMESLPLCSWIKSI